VCCGSMACLSSRSAYFQRHALPARSFCTQSPIQHDCAGLWQHCSHLLRSAVLHAWPPIHGTANRTARSHQWGTTNILLQGSMPSAQLIAWRRGIAALIAATESQLAARGVATDNNAIFTFREIAARGRHRFDMKLDMGCAQMLPLAAWLTAAAPWLPVVQALLGHDAVCIQSVVFSRPGADAQVPLCPCKLVRCQGRLY
jgi:hypothetical protein